MTLTEFLDKLEADDYVKFKFAKDIKEMRKTASEVDKPNLVTKEDIDSLTAFVNKLKGGPAQAPVKRAKVLPISETEPTKALLDSAVALHINKASK